MTRGSGRRTPADRPGHAGKVVLPHGTFEANAVPDVFDSRDLDYRPRLQALPKQFEARPADRFVMSQQGNSCTGHSVAAMINAVLASGGDATHVSPYMLYALARRYDEYPGEADTGSSLRGALKGWYYHGVLPAPDWPDLAMATEPDVDHDEKISLLASQRPLGAFYRVNASRLDDLQSAVTELSAIAVSASIHDGWREPVLVTRTVNRKKQRMYVITRTPSSKAIGGHAFCIAGYNEVGFLVQNSWGREWGHDGFATLPYDDWLDCGHDAWVARPGVPSLVSDRTRRRVLSTASGGLVDAPGPDLTQLADHVVNLGNDGRLSTAGRFSSSVAQLDRMFEHMGDRHTEWGDEPRRIMLYAHGGLDSEHTGLTIAQQQVNWWLHNKVYPITFAWQTGVTETIEDQLTDLIGAGLPAAGWSVNLYEQVDRLVEKLAKNRLRWLWDQMKQNATAASEPLPRNYRQKPDQVPGASLTVARLKEHLAQHPRADVEVHLVGHSAGTIFLSGLIERLVEAGITISSLTYLAAAIRTDDWVSDVLPHLQNGDIAKFAAFGLSPARELDDVCGTHGITVYHKSLLYLVSRAFERPSDDDSTEVPLVGMAHCATTRVRGRTFAQMVENLGGDLIWSPSAAPPDGRSDSTSHGGFDNDSPTMTSVLLRVLGQETIGPGNQYVANLHPDAGQASPTAIADQPPEIVLAGVENDVAPPGLAAAKGPVQATTRSSTRPSAAGTRSEPSRVLRALERDGWKQR